MIYFGFIFYISKMDFLYPLHTIDIAKFHCDSLWSTSLPGSTLNSQSTEILWVCTCLLYLVSAVVHLVIIYESCENKSPFIFYERGQKRGKYSWSIMSENHACWVISVNITQSCDDGESQDVSIRTALSMMLFHYCSLSSCLYLHVFFFFILSILELVLV